MESQKNPGGCDSLVSAAREYIEGHCLEKFSLKGISEALYVNGSYLLRTFKHHTGMTPLCYHHRVRCAKAKDLLTETSLSISQVGESVGFVSSSHFSHIFRKTEGCTPSEYRKQHIPDDEERSDP